MTDQPIGIEPEMNRGFVKILVLLVLETPMYGYQMARTFETIGYAVEGNTLYPLLRRLEKNHWISSRWEIENDRPKKYYRITETGREVRRHQLDIWRIQTSIIDQLDKEKTHE